MHLEAFKYFFQYVTEAWGRGLFFEWLFWSSLQKSGGGLVDFPSYFLQLFRT